MSGDNTDEGSRSTTPNPRFITQAATAEDVLKSQTVGLVQLADYKKRRAEALEFGRGSPSSGASTPTDRVASPPPAKKKRKHAARGKLSFAADDEADEEAESTGAPTSRTLTPQPASETSDIDSDSSAVRRRLGPNASIALAPKAKTKNALLKEAQQREQLRKEFLLMQEAVKATEIVIPFVFYDGANIPGGRCRAKKGDQIWLFLDKARKVGAELGPGGDRSRREWARISVDDLLLVRNEMILPHHYDFYYFLVNKSEVFDGKRVFDYSAQPTAATTPMAQADAEIDVASYDPLARPREKQQQQSTRFSDDELEGADDDPSITKVVDRRWYERNKHIFPASVWEEFDATKDYSKAKRKDTEGNSFFFS